jgi:hypothetical protein
MKNLEKHQKNIEFALNALESQKILSFSDFSLIFQEILNFSGKREDFEKELVEKNIRVFGEGLKVLQPLLSEAENLVSEFKSNKSKPKVAHLIDLVKLEQKVEDIKRIDFQLEQVFQKSFGSAKMVDDGFAEDAQKFLEETENLNERVLCLNEEVILRLDQYLQMQSKITYYYGKAIEEQNNSLKIAENNLERVKNELTLNLNSLEKCENQHSKSFCSQFFYLFFISFILGIVFAKFFSKEISIFKVYRPYF